MLVHSFENYCKVVYYRQQTKNAAFLIECRDRFYQFITKPTVLVLGNAPIHRSHLFKEQLPGWQEKDLFIFFLPKCSPHLNLAEAFWRK